MLLVHERPQTNYLPNIMPSYLPSQYQGAPFDRYMILWLSSPYLQFPSLLRGFCQSYLLRIFQLQRHLKGVGSVLATNCAIFRKYIASQNTDHEIKSTHTCASFADIGIVTCLLSFFSPMNPATGGRCVTSSLNLSLMRHYIRNLSDLLLSQIVNISNHEIIMLVQQPSCRHNQGEGEHLEQ